MYKLTFKKRTWIVKQVIKGIPRVKVALAQGISDRAVRSIMQNFKQFGWDGLKDHKGGRPETRLNQSAVEIIFDIRRRYRYGACHIEQILRKKGFAISHRQIEKVLVRNCLVTPNLKIFFFHQCVHLSLTHKFSLIFCKSCQFSSFSPLPLTLLLCF